VIQPVTDSKVMIQMDQVTRVFGDTLGVDCVSLQVHAGEVLGFIGPNGAGKTTSMRILSTLDLPTSGDAWIDGFSVTNDPDRVRRRIGWMPDGFGTYPDVSCEEYLDFFARSYGIHGAERRSTLRNVMGFTQLDELAFKPIAGLSKGMKQRLCLGRALIHNPGVLILDEPAAGLDPRARIELREMIRALADEGKAILVSSHILTELAEMCDRVAIIEQGQLLAVGTVDEILARQTSDGLTGSVDNEKTELEIQVLSDPAVAIKWLEAQPNVGPIRTEMSLIKFPYPNDSDAQASLLASMIHADIRVARFNSHQRSLEDVFLQVTQGRIQ
jgi:ABC-2 type transport system ATP-binding protein